MRTENANQTSKHKRTFLKRSLIATLTIGGAIIIFGVLIILLLFGQDFLGYRSQVHDSATMIAVLGEQLIIQEQIATLQVEAIGRGAGADATSIANQILQLEATKTALGSLIDETPSRLTITLVSQIMSSPAFPTATYTNVPLSTSTPMSSPTTTVLAVLVSSFEGSNTEGWTAPSDLMTNPGIGGNTTGTTDDGHLRIENREDGLVSYYIAPPIFHTDWRPFSHLNVDLWSSGGREYFTDKYGAYGDVYISNGPLQAWRYFPRRPGETWETFKIPLTDDGLWIFGSGTMRLEDVLANVTTFEIRAEYSSGNDLSGLDNVILSVEE